MKVAIFYLFFVFFIQANICWAQNAKDTLLILDDGSYAPYCFTYNNKNNKKVAGIIVDIWLLWSKKTGIPIKFILTNTFNEAIRKVEGGMKGVVSGICPKYRKHQLLYSNPYYHVTAQPILKKEREIYFKNLHEGNFIFGTCQGDVINNILEEEYPNVTVKQIDGYSNVIDSLLKGSVSGILIEEPLFRYRLFEKGELYRIDDFAIMQDTIQEPICVGVSDPNLLPIINNGFSKISTIEVQKIEEKWIKRYEPNFLLNISLIVRKWITAHPILSLILIVVLVLFCINTWLLYIYLHKPYKLFNVKHSLNSLPEIKIPIKNVSISIKTFIIINFLIRSKRAYSAYYNVNKKDILRIIFANLDLDISRFDYIPFPIKINESAPNILPLSNSNQHIKAHLQNQLAKQKLLRIIFCGSGGIGKTTLCAQIIKWVIEDHKFFPVRTLFLPIDFRGIDETLPLEEFKKLSHQLIFNLFSVYFEKKVDEKFFNFCLNNFCIVLVIDSFSEYNSLKRSKITSFISSWEKDKVGILVTSRYLDYSIGNFDITIEPDFLKSAFLLNLIQLVYMNKNDIKKISKDESKMVNELFSLLNKITNDNGVTPLYCILFSRELSSFNFSDVPASAGLNKVYEKIFVKYIERVICKIQDVKPDSLEKTIEIVKNFASFFAWKQVSIEDLYSVNNYLSLDDLNEFPEAETNLKMLRNAGSFLIERNGMYKIKFDPVAEFLVNLYLYKSTRNNINNKELNKLIIEPYMNEKLFILKSFHAYLKDLGITDHRTEDLLVLVEDSINTIEKSLGK